MISTKKYSVLLITPPLTQLNAPYPATAYLKGFLSQTGFEVNQVDLGNKLVCKIFSKDGLQIIFDHLHQIQKPSAKLKRILKLEKDYVQTIKPVIHFLQNKDTTIAYQICNKSFLPRGPRFENETDLTWTFGELGVVDRAKYLSTLYLEDLADIIQAEITEDFGFSRYAERIGLSATYFSPIKDKLNQPDTIIDRFLLELFENCIESYEPDLVAFTIPFPGCLYSALKCCQHLKRNRPGISTVFGGGYVSTELREISSLDFFKYVDYLILDQGEIPLLRLVKYIAGDTKIEDLHKTYTVINNELKFFIQNDCENMDSIPSQYPDYSDIRFDDYLSILEIANPMHRLWNDGKWNKLTIAQGCYWHKCRFCDTKLDYIRNFVPHQIEHLVDSIEKVMTQTHHTGFHFVDEAAPPESMKNLALEILKRGIKITWWANIRFEKKFTKDLCRLLAESGCIAVTGGLEVADDRLLKKMRKGISVSQAATVCANFRDAGIMVHSYLMYGFPTQTEQELINSLEITRQFFENDLVQSGFWHRFSLTAHSEIAEIPDQYGLEITGPYKGDFAFNDLFYTDTASFDYETYSNGLKKALFNYMHGIGIDFELSEWFDFKIPSSTMSPDFIRNTISDAKPAGNQKNPSTDILWIGRQPEIYVKRKGKKGNQRITYQLVVMNRSGELKITMPRKAAEFFINLLPQISPESGRLNTFDQWIARFETDVATDFEEFMKTDSWKQLQSAGLLLL